VEQPSVFPSVPSPAAAAPIDLSAWARASGDIDGWARRLGDLMSPALAQAFLAPAEAQLARALIAPDRAAKARLYNRFQYHAQLRALTLVAATGAVFVCLKGFANAHRYYADPQVRIVGDLDILVRREDLARVAWALAEAGFRAVPTRNLFGFLPEASFVPVVSPDRQVWLDLHVEPDAWPAELGLDADRLFAGAARFTAGGTTHLAPSHEHAMVLIVTNLAKDRFGPEGMRKVADAFMLLGAVPGLDWQEVARILARGGFSRAFAATTALLAGLGVPGRLLPQPLPRPPAGFAGREFRRVLAEYRSASPVALGPLAKLRRETLLGPDALKTLRIHARRLKGLVRPRSGLPPAMEAWGPWPGRPEPLGMTERD
jgi:Uncharacterised nucleotidyltransferase